MMYIDVKYGLCSYLSLDFPDELQRHKCKNERFLVYTYNIL